ncbi:hydrophobic surface binding protein A-domain-containing protein [Plectosphaerella plurivora]|uniref:Hydrophobic surface binding protein A-domain-containing protein n=1 Tax=Plectosphaerella plurivora TaxID=936078 RepID=A0A9P8V568_9PEZI|nr:hydrophobic surface binding protein A-domain-containing protein [Plectosphaerella plurivora]
MQLSNVFVQALLAGSAAAQLATIQAAITTVQTSLGELTTAVKGLNAADANTAAPILAASTKVQSTLKTATTQVQGAEALGLMEALGLQNTAGELVTAVQGTVSALTAKKADLDKLGVTAIAVKTLQDQQQASSALSTAIVSKVPAIGKNIAQQSIAEIDTAIKGGITALQAGGAATPAPGGGAAPAPAPARPGAPARNGTAPAPARPAARPAARVRRAHARSLPVALALDA